MNNSKLPIRILFLIIPFILASWFLVHALAILGVFLAFAYPVWWLFAPQQTFCLLCRSYVNGSICPFCRRQIDKTSELSPVNLRSALLNGMLVFAISIISIGVVFVESKILFQLGFPPTPKSATFVIPPKGQYRLGEIFPMKIEIDNVRNSINAVQADIGFEPQKLEVRDISTNESFANIFIQKQINNDGGWARLTGGLPNPGFPGNHGTFGTVFFKGKSPGIVKISFLPSSMVLANDGRGTNILKELPSVSYLILPEKISKEEEDMQSKAFSQPANVLGTSTDNVQMKFYDEGNVLGSKTNQEIQINKSTQLFQIPIQILEKVDTFTINAWSKIGSLIIKNN